MVTPGWVVQGCAGFNEIPVVRVRAHTRDGVVGEPCTTLHTGGNPPFSVPGNSTRLVGVPLDNGGGIYPAGDNVQPVVPWQRIALAPDGDVRRHIWLDVGREDFDASPPAPAAGMKWVDHPHRPWADSTADRPTSAPTSAPTSTARATTHARGAGYATGGSGGVAPGCSQRAHRIPINFFRRRFPQFF